MIASALTNTPGSLQVSAAQALEGISDECKLPAWDSTGPQKRALNLPLRQDCLATFAFQTMLCTHLRSCTRSMFCTLEGERCSNRWCQGQCLLAVLPWEVGGQLRLVLCLGEREIRYPCAPKHSCPQSDGLLASLAGTPAQRTFLLPLLRPHPSLWEGKSGRSPDLAVELSCSSLGSCLPLKVSPAEAEEPSKRCRGKHCCCVCRQAAAVTVPALLLPRPSWMVIRALNQADSAPAVKEAGLVPRSCARPSESGERVNPVGLWEVAGSLMIIPSSCGRAII